MDDEHASQSHVHVRCDSQQSQTFCLFLFTFIIYTSTPSDFQSMVCVMISRAIYNSVFLVWAWMGLLNMLAPCWISPISGAHARWCPSTDLSVPSGEGGIEPPQLPSSQPIGTVEQDHRAHGAGTRHLAAATPRSGPVLDRAGMGCLAASQSWIQVRDEKSPTSKDPQDSRIFDPPKWICWKTSRIG